MKRALFFEKKEGNIVQCMLCPRLCIIKDKQFGFCNARLNKSGTLYSAVYGKPVAVAVDPVEKKPLYHFLPGSKAYSIGTIGCNLYCLYCQNDSIARASADMFPKKDISPEDIVESAVNAECRSLAYTYNEPSVFYEYMLDIARIAKKNKIRNIAVSNGYINKNPLTRLCRHMDAFNIDLKGFNDDFYRQICSARLNPVLQSLKKINAAGVWLEITNLLVPTLNDNIKEFDDMCRWIKNNLGRETPLHISRFFPMFRLQHLPRTPEKTLMLAKDIADKHLDFVYVGNVHNDSLSDTKCPKCNSIVIRRSTFGVHENRLIDGKCSCNHKICGIWKQWPTKTI